jgi:hypothetical protein
MGKSNTILVIGGAFAAYLYIQSKKSAGQPAQSTQLVSSTTEKVTSHVDTSSPISATEAEVTWDEIGGKKTNDSDLKISAATDMRDSKKYWADLGLTPDRQAYLNNGLAVSYATSDFYTADDPRYGVSDPATVAALTNKIVSDTQAAGKLAFGY